MSYPPLTRAVITLEGRAVQPVKPAIDPPLPGAISLLDRGSVQTVLLACNAPFARAVGVLACRAVQTVGLTSNPPFPRAVSAASLSNVGGCFGLARRHGPGGHEPPELEGCPDAVAEPLQRQVLVRRVLVEIGLPVGHYQHGHAV